MSKKSYSEAVKKACRWWDEAMMKKEMERMGNKKMRTMVHQNLDLKDYVWNGSLVSARKTWQIRCFMLAIPSTRERIGNAKPVRWRSARTKNTSWSVTGTRTSGRIST